MDSISAFGKNPGALEFGNDNQHIGVLEGFRVFLAIYQHRFVAVNTLRL
jgi:hypothetical protein